MTTWNSTIGTIGFNYETMYSHAKSKSFMKDCKILLRNGSLSEFMS